MAKKPGRPIKVRTDPDKEFMVGTLTKDASVEACIFDLIDNSIDSARNVALKKPGIVIDEYGRAMPPISLANFKISVNVSAKGVRIEDNCGGIDLEQFGNDAFRYGKRSSHTSGIGLFGVGLKRALFKLGNTGVVTSDDGSNEQKLILNVESYLASPSWEIDAHSLPSSGISGTVVEISEPSSSVSKELGDENFHSDLKEGIAWRYWPFLKAGLTIEFKKDPVSPFEIELRTDGPFKVQRKTYEIAEGVWVDIQAGQHAEHLFPAEPGWYNGVNDNLTPQFGWSIVCNDRAIVLSDTSEKTGWEKQWHSEMYGFVGYVRFYSLDPSKLPWNTSKTDVDTNDFVYRDALEEMLQFVGNWRKNAGKAKTARKKGESLTSAPPKTASAKPVPSAPDKGKQSGKEQVKKQPAPTSKKPTIKEDHNDLRTVLPEDIDEKFCFDKQLALIHEGKTVDMVDCTYTGLCLLRMLFEISSKLYMRRHGKYGELKDYATSMRNEKSTKALTKDEEKKLTPTVDEIISYLINTPEVLDKDGAKHLVHSVANFSKHQKKLNSAIHQTDQQINWSEALAIRDEVLPILRQLIEK